MQPPLSDTLERMLRPQGLFQNAQQVPASWQQPQAAAPGNYPAGGQYPPQGAPYPPGAAYQPGGQYPPAEGFQQAAPPQAWGAAPTGAIPVAPTGNMAALPPGAGYPAEGQYPERSRIRRVPRTRRAGQYAGPPYGNGQYGPDQYGQEGFPPGPYGPGGQYGPDGMPLAGGTGQPGARSRLPFKRPTGKLVPVAVGGGLVVIVVAALMLSMHGGSSNNAGRHGRRHADRVREHYLGPHPAAGGDRAVRPARAERQGPRRRQRRVQQRRGVRQGAGPGRAGLRHGGDQPAHPAQRSWPSCPAGRRCRPR